jgi:hypothetical protein
MEMKVAELHQMSRYQMLLQSIKFLVDKACRRTASQTGAHLREEQDVGAILVSHALI